jgi:hypothetical protein
MSLAKDDLAGLPDDVRDLIRPHLDPAADTLESISLAISQKRDDAKTARLSSGIEAIWEECEEAYIGVDAANRGEFGTGTWAKPMSSDGPVTTKTAPQATDHKSTVFLRLTARYVDAGTAKLAEILLPANDKAFSITETPLPDLIKAKDDHSQVMSDEGIPLTRPAKPGEVPAATPPPGSPMMAPAPSTSGPVAPVAGSSPPAAVGATPATAPAGAVQAGAVGPTPAPRVPLTVSDLANENLELARKKAKMAETRIYDWMVKSRYTTEMRKVIFDAAKLGSGVVKGPFPKASRGIAVNKAKDGGVDIEIKDDVKPGYKRVDLNNAFPDPSCGEDIHDGDYFFERDYLSARQVRKLKKLAGYVGSQIDKVLTEGPQIATTSQTAPSKLDDQTLKKGRFEVWYYYGMLTRDELNCVSTASGKALTKDDVPEDKQQVYAICTMINSTVVRATINPLDSGEFPYHIMCWQRRAGYWAGIGVAEQLRAPQRMLNAATRAMLNNAGKSAGSQIVLDQGAITPADGNFTITPDKIWYKSGDSMGQDVNEAFAIHEIPNVTDQMLKIIDFALKQAEEVTSIPLVTQGQSGATTPETFGATQLQDNNANQLLRNIGWSFDDSVTEPLVRQSYEYLLLDPDVPEEEKGDFVINAHGSIALVERAIQNQTLAQLLPVSLNPAYGIDPKRCAKEFLKSKSFNPVDLNYTNEELADMAKNQPQPIPVQVANINASVVRDGLVAKQSAADQTVQHEQALHEAEQALAGQDTQNDTARIAAEQQRTQTEATVRLHEIQMKRDVAIMDYANRMNISLAQAKKDLAKTAMTLQAQRDLNAADNAVDLHKHHNPSPVDGSSKKQPTHIIPSNAAKPLAQTPGRAPNGRAFEQ